MNKIIRSIVAVAIVAGVALQNGCTTESSESSTPSYSSTQSSSAPASGRFEPTRPGQSTRISEQTQSDSGSFSGSNTDYTAFSGSSPAQSAFDRQGVDYVTRSMAYPSGVISSSSVLVEKTTPQEILVGAPYSIEYVVKNITSISLTDVVLSDQTGDNFNMSRSTPVADETDGNISKWNIGDLGPGEMRRIVIEGSSSEEGFLTNCADLTFRPAFCDTIRIAKGNLQLVQRLPETATTCEVIPMRLIVTNTGSGRLTNLVVTDDLPRGLTTTDGQTRLNYNVGTLNSGESREFNVNLKANTTGSFVSVANANSAQGIKATDSATVVVQAPELALTCDAPNERFIGRPLTVCYTVTNIGDSVATNSKLRVPVPGGLNFQGATGNGRIEGNSVVWNIASLAPEASRELCATFTSVEARRFSLAGTLEGDCAAPVTSSCNVDIQGIPAILLEVVDLEDPIEVGSNVTYQITVTNQGSAPATGVRIACTLEDEQQFVSATGTTNASADGQRVILSRVPSIAPGQTANWRITVRALQAANVRFSVSLDSDQIGRAVSETESTNQY